MLFVDGVYVERPDGRIRFHRVKAPPSAELTHLADTSARGFWSAMQRVAGLLADTGEDDNPMGTLPGHSIIYRIAVGPNA